ncbi:hypothetical protein MAPG_06185 [Magnaporthiopsis poae ATCC 64411]|uniref:F-box domain-containing protein n=1 Tax=Magnaporthiopsis poae (strain ATCC 64411 / 73-15) TaxID=644358 RepID=A0A0C4E1C8_MAGP6|nr:hypothetical protein MAPG_06185 [Magnaporthiopsis poae ATCC 64411]
MPNITNFPDELLLNIFKHVEEVGDTRLTCRKFNDIATEHLIRAVVVDPTEESLARFQQISLDPVVRRGIRRVRIRTFGFAPEVSDLARFRALWPTRGANWTSRVYDGVRKKLGDPIGDPMRFSRQVAVCIERIGQKLDLIIEDYATGSIETELYLSHIVANHPRPPHGHGSINGAIDSLALMYERAAGRFPANGEAAFAQAVCVDLPIRLFRRGKRLESYNVVVVSPFTRDALRQALPGNNNGGALPGHAADFRRALGATRRVTLDTKADAFRQPCVQTVPLPAVANMGTFERILQDTIDSQREFSSLANISLD